MGRFWEGKKVKLKRKESTMLRVSVFVTLLFVVGITLSQATLLNGPETEVALTNTNLVEHGLELYLSNSCGVCHTFSKADTKGSFGPSHDGLGSVASARIQDPNYNGQATTAAAYIKESLLEPGRYLVQPYGSSRYKMPAYVNLSDEDIEALTSFLLQP